MEEPLDDRNLISLTPLTPPRDVKRALPASAPAAATVRTARAAIRDLLHGRDPARLLVGRRARARSTIPRRRRSTTRTGCARSPRRPATRSSSSCARTSRSRARRSAGRASSTTRASTAPATFRTAFQLARRILLDGQRARPPVRERGSRPDDAAVPRRPPLAGRRSARARRRARRTARWRAASRCRSASRTAPTAALAGRRATRMISARHPHSFLGIDADGASAIVQHARQCRRATSCSAAAAAARTTPRRRRRGGALAAGAGAARGVMVDCSHDNSGKDPSRQGDVCRERSRSAEAGQGALWAS